MADDVKVTDNPDESRYELQVEGSPAGQLAYTREGDVVVLVHTEVDGTYSGRGLAGTLVESALDDLRGRGLKIRPDCPYVQSWLKKHQEYADLVA